MLQEHTPSPVLPGAACTEAPRDVSCLIRSNTAATGFKGVYPNRMVDLSTFPKVCRDRFRAECSMPPCHHNRLGNAFGTAEEAAQVYLDHQQSEHPAETEPVEYLSQHEAAERKHEL